MTGRWVRGLVAAACAVLLFVGVACTSDQPGASTTPDPTSVSSGGSPPQPSDVTQARFTGRYRITLYQIQTNVQGTDRVIRSRWRVHPRCPDGACDAIVNAVTGETYRVRAVLVDGSYRWTTNSRTSYWCQPDGRRSRSYLESVSEYSVDPVQMALVNDIWVATRFSGIVTSRGLATGGCERPQETYAIRAWRISETSP
jgi:hypothetical protein